MVEEHQLQQAYDSIINLCMQSRAYYRHTFCNAKNKNRYLKIVTRKGVFFTKEECAYISSFVKQITETDSKVVFNEKTSSLTVTLYAAGTKKPKPKGGIIRNDSYRWY